MSGENEPLRVCYFGTYRAAYGRNQIMIAGLRASGVLVDECHETLWHGIEDRVQQLNCGWRHPSFWLRLFRIYFRLWRRHSRLPHYDVMVLGYPGVFDAYLARLLSWWRRRPLVLDHYMSLYLIAEERGLVSGQSWKGRLLRMLEALGLRLPDLLISDTAAYVRYHCQTYRLQPDRFALVPAGADDRQFYPRPELGPPEEWFRVVYYGTFIPNHGVPTMIEAARLLQEHSEIRFDFYGDGPDAPQARKRAEELENVYFHGWLDKEALPRHLAAAHLCLGVFGVTPQSLMTIQNKIWEAAAMARPLVSGVSPTIREAFTHRENIYLVERDNAQALADAILELAADPALRERLAENAYRRFCATNSVAALGRQMETVLRSVFESRSA